MFPQIDPATLQLIGVVLILASINAALMILGLCHVSGKCSREEEERDAQYRHHKEA